MIRAAAFAALCLAVPAAASGATGTTFSGDISSDWAMPTAVPAGTVSITGTGAANQAAIMRLTLAPGAQTLNFTFSAPSPTTSGFAAGGSLRWSEDPFQWNWGGADAGEFGISHAQPSAELDLDLPDAFGGELHLGLYFTYGQLAWVLNLPAAPVEGAPDLAPAPDLGPDFGAEPTGSGAGFPRADGGSGGTAAVPGPAAGLLLLTALGALGAARRRRRPARA